MLHLTKAHVAIDDPLCSINSFPCDNLQESVTFLIFRVARLDNQIKDLLSQA